MVYQSEQMTYNSVRKVFHGKVNDVEICESAINGPSAYYTLLLIKDHEIVKELVRVLESTPEGSCCQDFFDTPEGFCAIFGYVKERRLEDFFMAKDMSLATCEEICLNLVVQCMTSGIPYPLLQLILEQRQIELRRDNSVALNWCLDLEKLDEQCDEAHCVMQCALIIRDMLEKKITKKNVGYKLLAKKIPRQSYVSFRELYKDIRLATSSAGKRSLWARFKAFLNEHEGMIFRIILITCSILIIAALVVLISKAVWGDIPLLRLFYNTFNKIGTESLID